MNLLYMGKFAKPRKNEKNPENGKSQCSVEFNSEWRMTAFLFSTILSSLFLLFSFTSMKKGETDGSQCGNHGSNQKTLRPRIDAIERIPDPCEMKR
jgi:hypothetical protein